MKIFKQKNVYFLNVQKRQYNGYIETDIYTNEKCVEYFISNLNIQSVVLTKLEKESSNNKENKKERYGIKTDDDCINLNYKIISMHETIENNKKELKIEFYKQMMDHKDILHIELPDTGRMTIRIEYKPTVDNRMIHFYKSTHSTDNHLEVVGYNFNFDSSFLFPTIVFDRNKKFVYYSHPWDLIYILTEDLCIISPGNQKGITKYDDLKIYNFEVENGFANHINFCVGKFDTVELESGDDNKLAFTPTQIRNVHLEELSHDILTMNKYLEYFLQKDTKIQLKLVFTMSDFIAYGKDTTFIPIYSLPPQKNINESFKFKEILAEIMIKQIIDINFIPEDPWISVGASEYLCDHLLMYFFGKNEFLYNQKVDMNFVVENDIYEYSLMDSRRTYFSFSTLFAKKKSGLFFHILEHNTSKAFMQKIISQLPQIKNTTEFIRLIKDVTGKDLTKMFEFYIFKPGLVKIYSHFTINKRDNEINLTIQQIPTSKMSGSNKKITGPIIIRSHEIEGIYDHELILGTNTNIVFNYHTRVKKNKKREEERVMPLLFISIDPQMHYLTKIKIDQPKNMYKEELVDKNVINQYDAIKMIDDLELLERIIGDYKIFYKIRIEALYKLASLNYPKIVKIFIKKFCISSSTVPKLNDFCNFPNYFILLHIMKSLGVVIPEKNLSNENNSLVNNLQGIELQNYESRTYDMNNYTTEINNNEQNNLDYNFYNNNSLDTNSGYSNIENENNENSNNPDYFFESQKYPDILDNPDRNIHKTLLSFFQYNLKYNDNSINEFDDTEYISTLINSMVFHLSHRFNENYDFEQEIERYRKSDLIFPSYRNVITVSILNCLGKLAINGSIDVNKNALKLLIDNKNFIDVRLTALENLIILHLEDSIEYIFSMFDERLICLKSLNTLKKLILMNNNALQILEEHREFFFQIIKKFINDPEILDPILEIIYGLNGKIIEIEKEKLSIEHEFTESEDKELNEISSESSEHIFKRLRIKRKLKINNQISSKKQKMTDLAGIIEYLYSTNIPSYSSLSIFKNKNRINFDKINMKNNFLSLNEFTKPIDSVLCLYPLKTEYIVLNENVKKKIKMKIKNKEFKELYQKMTSSYVTLLDTVLEVSKQMLDKKEYAKIFSIYEDKIENPDKYFRKGLNSDEFSIKTRKEIITIILENLMNCTFSRYFIDPVNIKVVPEYKKIKVPICLRDMLKNNYTNLNQLLFDFLLIKKNCLQFNGHSEIYYECEEMIKEFWRNAKLIFDPFIE